MKQALLEHIEAKIINLLHDAPAPVHASRIAAQIQEKREDTIYAIQKLAGNSTLRGVQDFALFHTTGETMAYTLAGVVLQQKPVDLPVPPQPVASSSQRPTLRGSACR